LIFKYPTVSFK